jgi:transcriptional antiterminator
MPAALPALDDDTLATRRKPVSLIQLADYVGVTRRTLYTHIEKGALKVVQHLGVIRVTAREARRYAGLTEPQRPRRTAKKPTPSTRRRRQSAVASV